MGYGHIFCIYDDGIRNAPNRSDEDPTFRNEVGDAVISLCNNRRLVRHPNQGLREVTSVSLGSHRNCINWVAELHSNEDELLLWSRSSLQMLRDVGEEDLTVAKKIIEDEIARRKTPNA